MSYDMIDRFLRNNLGDDDYAEYSAALDSLCTPQPKQEQGEPVAWACWLDSQNPETDKPIVVQYEPLAYSKRRPLTYTTPQQRNPLTDEQQKDAARWAYIRKHWKTVNFRFNKHPNTISGFTLTVSDKVSNSNSKPLDQEIDAAIEAAHGIKGEA